MSAGSARAALVAVEGVSKRFGGTVALDGVGLAIERGELFALLGPSGCGKTTLLRLLAGFEEPDGGRVLLDGEDMAGVPAWRRPVNMMFQSYALFPHMSVAGNVAFGLKQLGLPRAEVAARVEKLLGLVELSGLGGRRPHQLSGGQRQRVALARALAREPKLLLLDEPLAALDRKLRERTQLELVALQRRLGLTFVVVTHDQEEALGMASRIAVMDRGRIAQVGTPAEIYERPASRFVADFIGEVNLFEGRVTDRDNGLVTLETPEGPLLAPYAPGIAALAVRPEKMRLRAAIATDNFVEGRVHAIRYRGDGEIVHVALPSGKTVRVSRRAGGAPFDVGDAVVVSWAPADGVPLAS